MTQFSRILEKGIYSPHIKILAKEEVTKVHDQVLKALEDTYQAVLRG
ncbi:hypothetical protein NSQ93_11965 [Bacillus sp. FSL W8-0445]|jgi:phenylalanyl-tRNA synthetase beta subunit|uniref:Uncharacterized protein n=1 Tax=Bacillus licheniformis TaxID=1402 RepID=A0A8B5YIB7_BACLI|nr:MULTISPECIES: hypothetical protein [Bacillus]MBJ7886579.1 hypothetical protein [Bacillaceae bacterium HSR45]MDP4082653.1 hypothetical protein [Bacillota bacterium]AYC54077.1 hypothetical protein C7M53_0170 [Bacillus licheniformis]EQM26863.1 hypothetical protein N399_16650 [Bacillus licheniformis CG-B52]KUL10872.1 hypothetical protein LI17339_09455 [Bacillus licheniformis LMG 17339]